MKKPTIKKSTKNQAPALAGADLTSIPNQSTPSAEEEVKINIPALVIIENFLNKHYNFRYNVITSRIEFKAIKAKEYGLLNDYKLNSIYRNMKLNRVNTTIGELRAIINSDFIKEYDPFVMYFKGLPAWDGKTDYIEKLSDLVETADNGLFRKTFKKWLVAMVASACDPEIVNHSVLVFSGKQGVGKTTFMINLIPDELKSYIFSGSINPTSKDSLVQLSECLLINMDELETMSKSQIGDLKELITKSSIRIRRAYGFHVENLTRRASFSGSVNDKEFLNDSTGNRRFLCHDVRSIDYKTIVPLNLVYAQAYSMFKSGYKFWFDGAEIDEITAHNEEFQNVTFEEELLLKYYEPISEKTAKLFLSTTDIATNLARHQKLQITNSLKQNLGKALNKHKFARVKKNGRWVYALYDKTVNSATSFISTTINNN